MYVKAILLNKGQIHVTFHEGTVPVFSQNIMAHRLGRKTTVKEKKKEKLY